MEIRGIKEYDHLILKYNDKTHLFEDVTDRVIYVKRESKSWYVVFIAKDGTKQKYNIALRKLIISNQPIKVTFDTNKVFMNKKQIKDVIAIQKFGILGYKLYFKDKKTKYVEKIEIIRDRIEIDFIDFNIVYIGNLIFDYYKTLAKHASNMASEELSIEKLLYNLYDKIKTIDHDSVLYAYTNNKNSKYEIDKNEIIYPFATNYSQMQALLSAFSNTLSVISGPPGTGKTQVILNIIANAVIQNKKIAVISNNNTAIENVYDKLQEYGFDFILAHLGNSNNVETFFQKKDYFKTKIKQLEFDSSLHINIGKLNTILENLYQYQNELVLLRQEKNEFEEEFLHFKKDHVFTDYSSRLHEYKSYEKYLALKHYLMSIKKIGFFTKRKLRYLYGIKNLKQKEMDSFINFLDYKYYEAKGLLLSKEIENREKYLEDNEITAINKNLKQQSSNRFKMFLSQYYSSLEECTFNRDNYKKDFETFTKRYPVILSTTQSLLRNCTSNFKFDLVIIDEASQSDILTSLLTMNVAKQMVIVGDAKQLSQIDNQDIHEVAESLSKEYKIDQCYQYKDNSILASVLALPIAVPNTVLREHYRCDSRIIQFCNKKFYNSELIVCTNTSMDNPLITIHTVPGNHARKNPNGTGQYNDREAQEIIELIPKLEEKEIGIITPFRAQAAYIQKQIETYYPYVEVDTIHKYQGREKRVVILSTVVNDLSEEKSSFITDFVTNKQLLNVAISRAVNKLYIIVSDKVYHSKNNTIAQLIDYIKYYCYETSDELGKVVSIFDQLYGDSYKSIVKSPLYKNVDSKAESLMIKLLNRILPEYPDYKLAMHVNLSSLVKDLSGFNDYEVRYIRNKLTHVDFVIFDKITYKPVLCIEVDGTKYHDYAKKQIQHDKIKNRVLEANGLNLIRLRTNESKETEKIKDFLQSYQV